MDTFIFTSMLYVCCFCISFWAFMGLDFEKFIRKGRTRQAQFMIMLISMATAYLVAQFLMAILYNNIFLS